MTTFILSTPMWPEIVQGLGPRPGVQRLPEGTQRGLPPPCVTSGADRNKTSCKPEPSRWPQPLQASGTHGSVYMVRAGTGGHVSDIVGRRELRAVMTNRTGYS